ncbi:MAG TPA: mechanosensitive ion channel domain-containing protein [Ktedonosporobacter sp.]|nr:mechanosensitive ion channel domain-containing protein [Ktedonosporobacter sp.]
MGNIILSSLTILTALVIGLLLRRLLVQRLHKTVLDNWIIQTLGILLIVILLIPGIIGAVAIWSQDFLYHLWDLLNTQPTLHSVVLPIVGNIFMTLLLIGLGIGIARTAKNLTISHLGERRIDINIRTLIGRIFYFSILFIATFWALSLWSIPIGIPVTVLGAIAVAITVSIQDILKDLVAGFYILIERPFFIGDQISVTSNAITYIGKVENVQLRATKLRLISGEEVTIPNTLVFGSAVVNNSYYEKRRAVILVTLPKEDFSREETPTKILQVLKNSENISEQNEPMVMFTSYTDKKITLTVRFWVASTQVIDISDVMYALYTVLPDADLVVHEPVGSV